MFMISLNYWNFKYGNNSNHVGEYHLGKGKNKGRHVSKFMNKSRHFNFNQDIDNIELNLCGNQNQQRQNWNGGKVSNNGKSNDNM